MKSNDRSRPGRLGSEAPPWLWALLGTWVVSTGIVASVLAPVDLLRPSFCRAPAELRR